MLFSPRVGTFSSCEGNMSWGFLWPYLTGYLEQSLLKPLEAPLAEVAFKGKTSKLAVTMDVTPLRKKKVYQICCCS